MQDWLCVKCSGAATLRKLPDGRVRPLCKAHGGDLPLMVRFTREVEIRFDVGRRAAGRKQSAAETCSVCRVAYPAPVSSHHTPEECAENMKPGSALVIRDDGRTLTSEAVGSLRIVVPKWKDGEPFVAPDGSAKPPKDGFAPPQDHRTYWLNGGCALSAGDTYTFKDRDGVPFSVMGLGVRAYFDECCNKAVHDRIAYDL